MTVSIDSSELTALRYDSEQWPRDLKRAAQETVQEGAKDTRYMVKARMPVDTGAARDSWGAEGLSPIAVQQGFIAGIYRFDDEGMTHYQGSVHETHNYIQQLNEGTSRQAPAGFIDAEVERQQRTMEADLFSRIERALR